MKGKIQSTPGRGPGPRRGIPHTLALPDQIRPRQSGDAAYPTRAASPSQDQPESVPQHRYAATALHPSHWKPPPAHSGALPTRHHYLVALPTSPSHHAQPQRSCAMHPMQPHQSLHGASATYPPEDSLPVPGQELGSKRPKCHAPTQNAGHGRYDH